MTSNVTTAWGAPPPHSQVICALAFVAEDQQTKGYFEKNQTKSPKMVFGRQCADRKLKIISSASPKHCPGTNQSTHDHRVNISLHQNLPSQAVGKCLRLQVQRNRNSLSMLAMPPASSARGDSFMISKKESPPKRKTSTDRY